MEAEKRFYTLKETAKILNVHYMTVRNEIARGNLKPIKIGSDYRVSYEELENYIKANETSHSRDTSRNNSR